MTAPDPTAPSAFVARHAVLAAGYGDRPDPADPADVLAMPIVLHIPKADPPPRSALLAAAASATVALCLDERVGPDDDGQPGLWQAPLREWADARIRKVSRRARGAAWLAAQDVDGVTVDVDGAQARALVPGPVGALDPRIRKLQIGGTDLDADEPGPVRGGVPVLWVNAALGMTVGKAAAQVGHASMILAGAMPVDRTFDWAADGYRCAVRDADGTRWAALCADVAAGRAIAVRDAGFTEVAPGSMTVIARLP
ncbi:peptidyl-tRNA hydrolase [Prescottella subtropica]|uniref:peptidyl-tRNA hydrolase n=1 Tax=Prescottella subtropica TaxID=2545757 RepID=UPI0010F8851F|nr:peptidyl-tRNA hydrolase [Prescottella subtropica]